MTSMTVAHYGLGPIGLGIAAVALERDHRVVGAVDIDPEKVGKDLGVLVGRGAIGVAVAADAAAALAGRPQLVFHSTQSHLSRTTPQLLEIIDAGANVISTCEELAFPWRDHGDQARQIDAAARARGVTVVGLGVNPGYVMDLLPILLTAPCRTIRAIRIVRVVDAGRRRLPLRRKVGAGMDRAAFERGVAEGRIGHVGLKESIAMIADSLGWAIDAVDERIDPVLDGGTVKGLHQVAVGTRAGQPAITLDLTMAVGIADPADRITIDGDPVLRVTVDGGIHGDVATCALAVNAAPIVVSAPPGLTTVNRLAPIHR